MFCSNCGQQIPDNSKFCGNCGARQQISQNTDPAPKTPPTQQPITATPTNPPKKEEKKKANVFVVLAVSLCAFLVGSLIIAPSMLSDSDKENSAGSLGSQIQQTPDNNVPNPAYDAIFDGTGIISLPPFFGMNTKSFAKKQEDGVIYRTDYGYEGDVVKQYVETYYIPVSGYSDTQKAEEENRQRQNFANAEALNCCSVTYKMGANYLSITCTYSDVDKPENYAELYNAQLLQENGLISMSKTETSLLSQGFVKKYL